MNQQRNDEQRAEPVRRHRPGQAAGSVLRGFRLGRLAGVEVRIDWSLLIVFLLVLFSLGAGVFHSWHPDWGPALRWGVALGAAVLFFASVLAHELSHALVARTQGVDVRRITLFIFGGMAHMEQEASRPRAELLIALAGPVASLLIGGAALFAGAALARVPQGMVDGPEQAARAMGPLASLLLWLGPINILLALFNMVPGFPLDGGRVLRALLWWGSGNLQRATSWATAAGKAFGWLLIAVGVAMALGLRVPIFGTGLVSGLWLVLIGWFLSSAAASSYHQFMVNSALEGIPVAELMRSRVDTVAPDATVEQLVDRIMDSEQRCYPVVGADHSLSGLACVADIRRVPREQWSRVQVGEIMTRRDELQTLEPEQEATAALKQLSRREVDQLPVVEDGRLLGLVRRQDIMKWIALRLEGAAPGM